MTQMTDIPAVTPVPPAADSGLIEDLAIANRILYRQAVVDGFGHVSVRHDKRSDHFLLARSVAPGMVTAADIMEFDADSEPVGGDARRPTLERFIHGEIYRARPDVMAVVHSHAASVIPFTVVPEVKLRSVYHMSGFLGSGAPNFEIRDVKTGSDLLIRDRRLGAALAGALGGHSVVLMRGHGLTVVGPSLKLAVYRAVYTEINARIQVWAIGMGSVTYLDPEEERAITAAQTDALMERTWSLWKMQVATAQAPDGAAL